MKYFLSSFLIIFFNSCIKPPSLSLTDKYLIVRKPGQSWALVEVEAVKLDSIFGYPKEAKFVKSFVVVDAETQGRILRKSKIKMYFTNTNKDFEWKIYNDFLLKDFSFSNIINIKPFTWYSLSSSRCSYELFLYRNESANGYVIKEKPKPGAF